MREPPPSDADNRGGFKLETLRGRPLLAPGEVFACPTCDGVHRAQGRHGTLFYSCGGVTRVCGVAGRNVAGLTPDAV